MADFDDLHLDRPEAPPPERGPGAEGVRWLVAAIVIVAILAAVYIWRTRRPPAGPPQGQATTGGRAPTAPPPTPVPGESLDLPPLGQTDPLVRQLVGRLSSHPRVAQWLATDQLIRNFTVVVTNVANGRSPVVHLQPMKPKGQFVVAQDAQGTYVDPESYRRYDDYADAISGLDPHGTAQLYETLKPRIEEAYRELGYPQADFDAALKRAVVVLLQTPVVEGRIDVAGAPPLYSFTDRRLESLSGAQRQLLRMGPRNERRVQEKLRELAPLLGISAGELPPARVIREGGSG